MTISQRLTRAALAFLLFGLLASLLPNNGGIALATPVSCSNATPAASPIPSAPTGRH